MGSLHQISHAAGVASDHAIDGPAPQALVGAATRGDLVAFEQLYRLYSPRIYGLCLRLTGQREAAEDCTQECFVAAWRALPRFQGRSAFGTWLHAIAVRAVLSRRRGLRARYEMLAADHDTPDPPSDSQEQPIDLERAIAQLPQGARDVLVLVGIYGNRHQDAAALLGIAEGSSKAQLHRARQLLARALDLEMPP